MKVHLVSFKWIILMGTIVSGIGFWLQQQGFLRGVFPLQWIGLLGIVAWVGWKEWAKSQQENERVKRIPLLLSQASVLTVRGSMRGLIHLATRETYAPLNDVFVRVEQLEQQGMSVSESLNQAIKEFSNESIRQLLRWLYYAEVSGYPIQSLLREQSQTLEEQLAIQRERQNNTMVEKYTLLLCAAVLVPFIAGSLSGMNTQLNGLSLNNGNLESNLLENSTHEALTQAIQLGSFIMRIEIGLMVSVLVALLDGSIQRSVFYATVIVPTSWIIFSLTSGGL